MALDSVWVKKDFTQASVNPLGNTINNLKDRAKRKIILGEHHIERLSMININGELLKKGLDFRAS